MKLFVDLYTDEDVDVLIADLLRSRGLDVLTTREAGRLRTQDRDQFLFAIQHQRAILTHNRADFEALANEWFANGDHHYGIIIAVRHSPYEIVKRLLVILDQVTSDEFMNQVCYI